MNTSRSTRPAAKTRKRTLGTGMSLVLLTGAGAAWAYWTTTGSGTGSAGTGSNEAMAVTQVGSVSGLYPGKTDGLAFKITNAASFDQKVATVTISMTSVTAPNATGDLPCTTSDFQLTQPSALDEVLPHNSDKTYTSAMTGAAITMKETNTNQDGCKGATVNLAFSAV